MPKLIKHSGVTDDLWTIANPDTAVSSELLSETPIYLSKQQYLAAKADQLALNSKEVGLWLSSEDSLEDLSDILADLPSIGLFFNAFADGRSFSQARILREQMDYTGEIRALGNFIRDQLTYLNRCGVDAFSVADDVYSESWSESLSDFSESYQAACDEPQPLFRRR